MAKPSSPQHRINITISDRMKKDLEIVTTSLDAKSSTDTIRFSVQFMKNTIEEKKRGGIIYAYYPKTEEFSRISWPHFLDPDLDYDYEPVILPKADARKNAAIYSSILIDSIGSLVEETQDRLRNSPARHQRTEDTDALLKILKSLLAQVKRLNVILTSDSKSISGEEKIQLNQHINKFIDGFAGIAGKGTGILVVTAGASLLTYIGVNPDLVSGILSKLR
jgi:hypothetical protein